MSPVTRVSCPGCGHALRIPEEWLEKKIRCKKCNASFRPSDAATASSANRPPSAPAAASDVAYSGADTIQDDIPPPAPTPESDPFAFSGAVATFATGGAYRLPKKRSWVKPIALGLVALLITGAGAAGFLYPELLGKSRRTSDGDEAPINPTPSSTKSKTADPSALADAFPRRLMLIGVHNYLYANPTSAGRTGRGQVDAVRQLAAKLRVPKEQYYAVTDALPGSDARPPLKPIIEQSVERFLATSRPQDRIVLIFIGHALDVDDQPYLVPLDGELTAKETLIPLKWLYDRLATCPACQKLLVMDVCRTDTSRGQERPGSGPMGAKLDAMLAAPPPGVQVWSACVAGQFSYEFDFAMVGNSVVYGGAFLSLLTQAFQHGGGVQKADEPLPLEFLVKQVNGPTATLAKAREKAEQTPRLSGTAATGGAAYDPSVPPPVRFEVPKPDALLAGGRADPKLVQSIFAEIVVPPLRLPREAEKSSQTPEQQSAQLAALFPFQAEALKPYTADYRSPREILEQKGKWPLREAVIRAVDTLDRQGRLNKVKVGTMEKNADRLIEEFRGSTTDDIKKSLTGSQKDGPALMLVELEEVHDGLLAAEKQRDKDPSKRWQANFDYILAQVKARMAYVHEYNTVIAKVKKDELPTLDPKIHKGWRLAASEKLQSPKDIKDLASDSKKLLAKIIKEYPRTPWEVMAKRERFTTLGLAWQPTSFADE